MRPRITEWLAGLVGPVWADLLVPAPNAFYTLAMLAMLLAFVSRGRPRLGSGIELAATAFWGMLGGIVGARVFYLIQHGTLGTVLAEPVAWKDTLFVGGTASWGAYIGVATGLILARRLAGHAALPSLDLAASVAGLGIAIGRLSCFLEGDDYGTLTSLPWGVGFPSGSPPFLAQVFSGTLHPTAAISQPVHPVQLYLALNGLVLFFAASAIWRRHRTRPGVTITAYLALYAVGRFALEFFRGDQVRYSGLGLSVPQLMSAATLALTISILVALSRDRLTPAARARPAGA